MRKTVVLLGSMALAVLLASAVALLSATPKAQAAPNYLYPNLKTLEPTDLRFGTAKINGTRHKVLRFSNSVVNVGQGPVDLRGKTVNTSTGKKTRVFQRIYDSAGSYKTTKAVGLFAYHPAHHHMHFGDFAEYQIWTKRAYNRWVNMGRDDQERFEEKGTKTTFCVLDYERLRPGLPGSPSSEVYGTCGETRQGLSVGWADTYESNLPGQFIDLGRGGLPNGDYVLRSVADPKNRIYESPNRRLGHWRESRVKNAAVTFFKVRNGTITVTPV